MRHQNQGRKFNMPPSHRKALLSGLAVAVLTHEKIKCSQARAKEAQ